jgi:hypothetical protein
VRSCKKDLALQALLSFRSRFENSPTIMRAVDRLLSNYSRQLRLPWAANMSGKQRVWFAVYPPAEERRVRARLPQFEALTLAANHGWIPVDLTRMLPEFLAGLPREPRPKGGLSTRFFMLSSPIFRRT